MPFFPALCAARVAGRGHVRNCSPRVSPEVREPLRPSEHCFHIWRREKQFDETRWCQDSVADIRMQTDPVAQTLRRTLFGAPG